MAEQPKLKKLTFEILVPLDFPDAIAVLHLLLLPDKNVLAVGPVGDKPLCYMMLEQARDAVKDNCDRMAAEAKNVIVKPSLSDVSRITQ